MKNHEPGCIGNPDRECTLCEALGICPLRIHDFRDLFPVPVKGGDGRVPDFLADPGYESEWERRSKQAAVALPLILAKAQELQEVICPICVLAMIRQSKTELHFNYDWKKEKQSLWNVVYQEQGFHG